MTEERKPKTISVCDSLWEKFKTAAKENDTILDGAVEIALNNFINGFDKKDYNNFARNEFVEKEIKKLKK